MAWQATRPMPPSGPTKPASIETTTTTHSLSVCACAAYGVLLLLVSYSTQGNASRVPTPHFLYLENRLLRTTTTTTTTTIESIPQAEEKKKSLFYPLCSLKIRNKSPILQSYVLAVLQGIGSRTFLFPPHPPPATPATPATPAPVFCVFFFLRHATTYYVHMYVRSV